MDPLMPPPPPFSDFDFSFDAGLQPRLPDIAPSAELFSPTETDTLLGFLNNFDDLGMGFDNLFAQQPSDTSSYMLPPPLPSEEDYQQQQHQQHQQHNTLPPPLSILTSPPAPEPAPTTLAQGTPAAAADESQARSQSGSSSGTPTPQPSTTTSSGASSSKAAAAASSSSKKQLSGPQKRLNHIMSEQKRRNAIRDGYATLTTMLAPAGTNIKDALPRRGRPRGSGARGKGRGKGKSGVLFRAVEYIAWLQENCDALEQEIARVESYPAVR